MIPPSSSRASNRARAGGRKLSCTRLLEPRPGELHRPPCAHRQHRRLLDRPSLELAAIAAADQGRVERHLPLAEPRRPRRRRPRQPRRLGRRPDFEPVAAEPRGRGQGLERRVGGRPGAVMAAQHGAALERVGEVAAARRPGCPRRAPAPRPAPRRSLALDTGGCGTSQTGASASTPLFAAHQLVATQATQPGASRIPITPGTASPPALWSSAPAGCPRSARRGPRHRPCRGA